MKSKRSAAFPFSLAIPAREGRRARPTRAVDISLFSLFGLAANAAAAAGAGRAASYGVKVRNSPIAIDI